MTTIHEDTIHDRLSAAVRAKSLEIGVRLVLGYVGNCEPAFTTGPYRFDDRRWMIWLPTYGIVTEHNQPSVGHHRTSELESLLAMVEDGAVERLVTTLEADRRMFRRPAKDVWGNEIEELDYTR